MKTILAVVALVFAVAADVAGQTATPFADKRQHRQAARIEHGVANGALTRRETAQSVRDQRRIQRAERRAKADGTVTRAERAKIQHEQNKATRQLRRNKHDVQHRAGA